jgi:3'-phosphoadenosine 5'-phosphosulfate sulfotransferase (PAPS reductase)/FAD synthetase
MPQRQGLKLSVIEKIYSDDPGHEEQLGGKFPPPPIGALWCCDIHKAMAKTYTNLIRSYTMLGLLRTQDAERTKVLSIIPDEVICNTWNAQASTIAGKL